MPATFVYSEDNGPSTGSPAKGTTRTNNVTQVNWKNTDDVVTAYSASSIVAGTNSFSKYQFGKFTGTFNQISNGLWTHTAGVLGTGLTLKGTVSSDYATPAIATNAALTTDITAVTAIADGLAVLFHTDGPEGTDPAATLEAAGYTQYLISQLQVASNAAAGDIGNITTTLRYYEN